MTFLTAGRKKDQAQKHVEPHCLGSVAFVNFCRIPSPWFLSCVSLLSQGGFGVEFIGNLGGREIQLVRMKRTDVGST